MDTSAEHPPFKSKYLKYHPTTVDSTKTNTNNNRTSWLNVILFTIFILVGLYVVYLLYLGIHPIEYIKNYIHNFELTSLTSKLTSLTSKVTLLTQTPDITSPTSAEIITSTPASDMTTSSIQSEPRKPELKYREDTTQLSPQEIDTSKWCLIGDIEGTRSCAKVDDISKCSSGQIFPEQSQCLRPETTQ